MKLEKDTLSYVVCKVGKHVSVLMSVEDLPTRWSA